MKPDLARLELGKRLQRSEGKERERWFREWMWRYFNPEDILGNSVDPVWLAARKQRRKRELIADLGLKVIQGGKANE